MRIRRDLLVLLGAAALAPRTAFAQAKKAPVLIGWLSLGSRDTHGHYLAAFKDGLAALGRKEGSNIVVEERWADGRSDRLPTLGGELAARQPAIIVASPLRAATEATKAAPRTPIVYIGGDPVAPGLAASLAKPGGMVTGVSSMASTISEKFLELLLAAAPKLRRIGFLGDTAAENHALFMENARRSVAQHAVEARYAVVTRPEEIEPALLRLAKERVQALVVIPGQTLVVNRRRIVKFAQEQRWPMIGGPREWVEEGALLSYWADILANYRRAAWYVDRILKDAKPGDLPIEQPTKFELVVNLKTAKAIGFKISQDLLFRADKVIE